MSDRTIWYFVKFFAKESHADQFIKGGLYLNRLSYFKKIETDDEDGRPDTHEAIAMWWQPDDLIIKFKAPGLEEIEITKTDLAGPVSMSFEYHDHVHIFCLYAMHTVSLECMDKEADLAENEAEFRRQLRVDERCIKFGPFAVVIRAVPFLAQLKGALLREKKAARGELVQYYDEETYHGEIDPKDIPFRKQKRFCYQQEFRICVQTNTKGDDPITIDIGDISHICAKLDSSRLNGEFKVQLSLAPPPDVPAK
jgi:hypothetical protein